MSYFWIRLFSEPFFFTYLNTGSYSARDGSYDVGQKIFRSVFFFGLNWICRSWCVCVRPMWRFLDWFSRASSACLYGLTTTQGPNSSLRPRGERANNARGRGAQGRPKGAFYQTARLKISTDKYIDAGWSSEHSLLVPVLVPGNRFTSGILIHWMRISTVLQLWLNLVLHAIHQV